MERGGGRCVYKGNADSALTIVHPDRGVFSLLNPGVAISAVRCQAHVFCICHFLLRKETTALVNRDFWHDTNAEKYELEKFESYT